MMYVIDGHNLIPHINGLHLSDLDDETALIQQLQIFHRMRKQNIEVFFDNASAGHSGRRKVGTVNAHFIRASSTADSAILAYLKRLGNAARNVTVVTSDRQVAAGARAYHAEVVDSHTFANEMQQAIFDAQQTPSTDPIPDTNEVNYWLKRFGGLH